jgi:hypothetical protein
MLADIGTDRVTAISNLLAARRNKRTTTVDWLHKVSVLFEGTLNSMLGSYTLHSLSLKGYLPEDFIERKIKFNQLKCYTIAEMTEFGFTFEHLKGMGFRPINFKDLEWSDYNLLNLCATKMLEIDININDIFRTGLTVQMLKELGFTQAILEELGLDQNSIPKLCSHEEFVLYFGSKFKRGISATVNKSAKKTTTVAATNKDLMPKLSFEF